MERDGSAVSALVGLDGFVVTAQLLDEPSGEWWLAVETTEDRAWCESCGVRATGHGRRRVVVRDLPLADRPVVLVWAKRLWRCAESACSNPTPATNVKYLLRRGFRSIREPLSCVSY